MSFEMNPNMNTRPERERNNLKTSICLITLALIAGIGFVTGAGILADYLKSRPKKNVDNSELVKIPPTLPSPSPSTTPANTSYPSGSPTAPLTEPPTLSSYQLREAGGGTLGGTSSDQWFGNSISLSSHGRRIAVGSNNYANGGLVQVFSRNGDVDGTNTTLGYNNWTQVGNDIYAISPDDKLGYQVSLSADGDYLAVSSVKPYPGLIDIYKYSVNETLWMKRGQELIGNGVSVSNNGTRVATAAGSDVSLFEFDNVTQAWVRLGDVIVEDSSIAVVSLSGDGSVVAVGSPFSDELGQNYGRVRVFRFDDSGAGKMVQVGWTLYGNNPKDSFGKVTSVSYDGSVLAVGSIQGSIVKVWGYDRDKNSWVQRGNDILGDSADFGWSVSLSQDGTKVVIGSPWYNGSAGKTSIYQLANGKYWFKVSKDIFGRGEDEFEGWDVSVSAEGGFVASGAKKADVNGLDDNGRVSIFELI
eukprot:CAMPEP_0172515030 /NCGR_PEP_ID=MMETSP1066-20121228/264706_1 /TAXON_ID=671091 /ORGANISM="Coscinodiscus wailesii, Strain CCMP2513" /LENGTH=471 /DNA_ID=CAMNT_0013295933 /DNA_START=124 /DNA_END=1539 /DNA_ORIENTATION=+